jgi:nucleoside-diphosphate-sugar epimerase
VTERSGPVVVTGGTGFIGRHLTDALVKAGVDVHLVVRRGSWPDLPSVPQVHRVADPVVETAALIRTLRPATVVHLATMFAAEHRLDQLRDMVESNVTLGAAVAEASTEVGARLVHASTAWQHFEGQAYSPVSLYAATKQACADVFRYYTEVRGMVASEVCLFDTYGPQDDRRKLVWLLLEHAASGAPLLMSSGTQLIDLTHVRDVVNALRLAVDGQADGSRLVVRSGAPLRLREVAAKVSLVTGRQLDIRWGARPDRSREMFSEWAIDGIATDWRPQIEFETGIDELWRERLHCE